MLILGALCLTIWIGLWLGHAWFWRIEGTRPDSQPLEWPPVAVVIPARNEAALLPQTLDSLWRQQYPALRIVVVDDHSEDGTAEAARRAASQAGREDQLSVLPAPPLPPGWTGKVWAMHQGAQRVAPTDGYILFSDADIEHGPGVLRELVARAEAFGADLVSMMVRLRCESPAERLMIPAFVFFFRLLYPFRRVNNPADRLAGAAGGAMLLRASALARIGGLESIRGEVIDDCSLARAVKHGDHRIWLGLAETSRSTRGYGRLGEIVAMVARTAYTQLGYSPWRLLGCVAALGLAFLAPPALALGATGWARWLGAAAWLLMAALYLPMVRFYNRRPFWAPLLPLVACVYLYSTVRSAWEHHAGRGGRWKGRSQSRASPG